jgi:hypothetical protein
MLLIKISQKIYQTLAKFFSDFNKSQNGDNVRENVKLEFCKIVEACLRESTHGQEFAILPAFGTLQRQAKTSFPMPKRGLIYFRKRAELEKCLFEYVAQL